ncbi:MAG: hypothetical protein JWO77_3346 [Ilumatobacteraceae bacterium]|nr:hypothetical protein [Ilumatobacteraceae bacterium]
MVAWPADDSDRLQDDRYGARIIGHVIDLDAEAVTIRLIPHD